MLLLFAGESKKEIGFTLIELITVIVVLALLAVFAIPRYLNVLTATRKSTILGVESALQSVVALVKARAKLEGDTGAGTVTLEKGEGGTVTVDTNSQLVPTANSSGIVNAIDLRDTQGKITITYYDPIGESREVVFSITGAAGNCRIIYDENLTTGEVTIAPRVDDC